MNRRWFLQGLVSLAATPLVAKLPMPLREPIKKIGAWASVNIRGGKITAVTNISSGAGYNNKVPVVFSSDDKA